MASLRFSSSAVLRPSAAGPVTPSPISSSLRPTPAHRARLRLPSLKLSLRRRPRRGGAAGATAMDTAASSYANALADVAKSNNTLEATMKDVDKVSRFFSNPSVQTFFANPTIPASRKQDTISEISTSSDLQLQPHVANFLAIVADMDRIAIIPDICKEFEYCYNKITGTEVAVVSSVVQLESQHLEQIAKVVQKFTQAKYVRIKTVIDPSLVAGFTIRYGSSGSKLIDMSVKKQLDEIASKLDFSNISLAI